MSLELEKVGEVGGRGGDGRMPEEELSNLLATVEQINTDSQKYWGLRLTSEATRYQRWPGQSPDGRQRSDVMGAQPFPFDGSSDQRVYWADTLTNEAVRLMIVSATRAAVTCAPRKGRNSQAAWRATQALRWFVDGMGQRWWQELTRAANYAKGDSPAVTVMRLRWRRTRELEMKRLTVPELAELWVRLATENGAGTPEEIAGYAMSFAEEMARAELDGEGTLAQTVMAYFDVTEATAERVVRELTREGTAEFPVPGEWSEGLECKALRYADNFYMPDGAQEWADVPVWFEVEWLSRPALMERVTLEGWSKKWADQVAEHAGEATFKEYETDKNKIVCVGTDRRQGLYQIVTAHYQAVNDYGLRGRYTCVFHAAVKEMTAYGRRIERDCAAVFFAGETTDGWLLNSRGIPELVGPAAGVMKGMRDNLADAGTLMSLPPMTGDGYGTGKEEDIPFEPLGYIPLKRGGKLGFVSGMQYPSQLLEAQKQLTAERDEQFARPTNEVPKQVADVAAEFEVGRWTGFLQEVLQRAMELIVRNVSGETLAMITDAEGRPVAPDGEGLPDARYDVKVIFDARTLDEERIIKAATTLTQMKQSDTENVLDMSPIIRATTRAMLPHHADEALRTGNEGTQDELDNELRNLQSIRAGVMPKMVTDGTWNYALRLGWYQELLTQNPAAMDDMAPEKLAMLGEWLDAMEHQAEQYGENRAIGRTGVEGVGE